ncbi:MAG: nucleoside triphosphate pyrophosphohydrolase [Acidobacteriota bacterium]
MRLRDKGKGAGQSFERLVELMARLRGPDGCAWDRKQTLESLRTYILEEAYELVDAVERSDLAAIREELGDLVLEVLFMSQICAEAAEFTIRDVLDSLENKIVRRHPHVFGSRSARDPQEALAHWEDIKANEKPRRDSLLEGVPQALPALVRAFKLSSRAARAGFDWKSVDDILEKLDEERRELETAWSSANQDLLAEELGDMLFVLVNLARHLRVDPEMALQAANRKFVERFHRVEEGLKARGRSPADSSLEEMEALWQQAKKQN